MRIKSPSAHFWQFLDKNIIV